jgi:hypothetical protein
MIKQTAALARPDLATKDIECLYQNSFTLNFKIATFDHDCTTKYIIMISV